ncbi:MAG: ATP-binding protein [Candidatus Symbiothrix sp.]|jgi:predicted AAA+ superfamily ATPase|nr:ATP-binding protein [Candidatus Symbiothrix sp.]
MERKFTNQLLKWKNSSDRMPLIVTGARQVGKTYGLLEFGKMHYKNTVYLNFENFSELHAIFERDLNPKRIIRELSVKMVETILPDDTLLIFDEIQACERALTSLKYFCEDAPQYHIAAAGSLLGVTLNRSKFSFPVGKIDKITLYPLDFEEFLWALGRRNGAEFIRKCFEKNEQFTAHNDFLDLYKLYLLIGGMPNIVSGYIKNQDFNQISALQRNINDAYIADMVKYAQATETSKILAAFNSVPAQLAKENHKFQYKIIKTGARAYDYEASLDWLQAAGIVRKCVKVTEGKFPLELFAQHNSFKVYLSDTGLLSSKYQLPANVLLSDFSGFENIKGALAENYVFSAMTANGYEPHYWESEGKAEVDFVFQDKNGKIVPVEVKSSEHNRSRSLNLYISKYEPEYSLRISAKNFGFENHIKSVPLYAVFCI